MPADLTGRVAIVTGGSRGIGKATAVALAARGATVVTMSRSAVVAAPMAAEEWPIEHLSVDVSNWESARMAVEEVLARHGRVDVLVSAAGMGGKRGFLWELEPDEFAEVLSVNAIGPFHMMKLVLPSMIEQGSGVIINISSGASNRHRPRRAMYGASKAALNHISLSGAGEVAPHGIRLHVFYPGPVDTELFNAVRSDPGATPADIAAIDERFRVGEVQAPEEPAAAIAWLATPSGAVVDDIIVAWNDPQRRREIRAMAGLGEPERHPGKRD